MASHVSFKDIAQHPSNLSITLVAQFDTDEFCSIFPPASTFHADHNAILKAMMERIHVAVVPYEMDEAADETADKDITPTDKIVTRTWYIRFLELTGRWAKKRPRETINTGAEKKTPGPR